MKYREYIENHIVKCDISYRGGVLKVDAGELIDTGDEPSTMGAYQNYLGGGIAGCIMVGRDFDADALSKKDRKVYDELAEDIKKYFYELNNGGGDEYMQETNTYERTQGLAVSGY